MIKLSEQVRRLEDTIDILREENKELRSKVGIVAEETIQDLQKRIAELSRELKVRVEQVENLQDTLKKITKENLELQEKLNKGCRNKTCKKITWDDDKFFDDNFRKMFKKFLWNDPF